MKLTVRAKATSSPWVRWLNGGQVLKHFIDVLSAIFKQCDELILELENSV